MIDSYISLPPRLTSDKSGYSFLSLTAGNSVLLNQQKIIVDFADCLFIEGNLCAILGNILESLSQRGNTIAIISVRPQVLRALARNSFLEQFGYTYFVPRYYSTSIPYKKFNLQEETAAKDFFETELFSKEGMPKMSEAAKKAILRNIFEICINAITHAGCEFVYCCGQVFQGKNDPRVIISFVDLGNTIKANVNTHLQLNINGNDAISWALKEGNTTKAGNEPGGLGLKLLQDLVFYNKGKLQIVSGDGFVEIQGRNVVQLGLDLDFPGTIVTLELKLGDPNFYILSTEKQNTTNIF